METSPSPLSSRLSRPAVGPERSAAEGSAVRPSAFPNFPSKPSIPKQRCHARVKPRDLLFLIRSIESEWKLRPLLCHPACPGPPWDRSEAQRKDLQCARRRSRISPQKLQLPTRGVIPPVPARRGTEAKRSGG